MDSIISVFAYIVTLPILLAGLGPFVLIATLFWCIGYNFWKNYKLYQIAKVVFPEINSKVDFNRLVMQAKRSKIP